tara:strand:+ start:920 stop:1654 length:735 start_codon:yes stop_codon:yes gene_type:complete
MKKYRILLIIPIAKHEAEKFLAATIEEATPSIFPDFEVTYRSLSNKATTSIMYRYDEYRDAQEIVNMCIEAEKEGFDGIFIDCFGEPSVSVVREVVCIPVVGGFMPAICSALMVSQIFSIVTVVPSVVPMLRTLARDMGIQQNLVSIREVGIPVDDLGNEQKLLKAAFEQSVEAINHGAESIVLGCTGMLHIVKDLENLLEEKFSTYIPVVAPTGASLTMLQSMIKTGLSQSRLTYFHPPSLKQ